MKNIIIGILFILNFNSINGQSNLEVLNFINQLPEIKFGILPYWNGLINGTNYFTHGIYSSDTFNIEVYNKIVSNSIKADSLNCYIINSKNQIVHCNSKDLYFIDKKGCRNTASFIDKNGETIEGQFCPGIFPSAKSIINNQFYIVYFWKVHNTENLTYFGLIFDFNGNLVSYYDLDQWKLNFPNYPFKNPLNVRRTTDYERSTASFLPNNLLYIKYSYNLTGGGAYFILKIRDDGHFQICKIWTEEGEINSKLTDNYKNYIRVKENGEKYESRILFYVNDADGFSNIREEPNSNSKILRTIKNKDIVIGTMTIGGWCKIGFTADQDGNIIEEGYIHSTRLIKLNDKWNEFIENKSYDTWMHELKQKI